MNMQEKITRMAELKAKAEENCNVYNTYLFEERLSEAEAVFAETDKIASDYNGISRTLAYDNIIARAVSAEAARKEALKAEETTDSDLTGLYVMRIACESPLYDTITVKTTNTEMVIDEREKAIDLMELQTYFKKPIGNDPRWKNYCGKFNLLMGCRAAIRYNLDPKKVFDEWAAKDIIKKIELGETPTSDTQLLKAAKTVIDAMIGEIKVVTPDGKEIKRTVRNCDIHVLQDLYSTKGKSFLSIRCPNERQFITIMTKLCTAIITGMPYSLDYKAKKSK